MLTCSPPAPADTRLTGLAWVSRDRFWGRNRFVTRLGVLPALVLANSKLPPSREVMGIVLEARAACIVASVLLFIRAGLRAPPRLPGARLRRAPPGANCEDAIRPGLNPAAAAMAAKLALVDNCVDPCSADSPGAVTMTCPVSREVAKEDAAFVAAIAA